jgi:hypothetical protein
MGRSMAAQFRHRLVSCALAAILSVAAITAPSVSQAGSPEERREAVGKSSPTDLERRGTIGRWVAADRGEANATPSLVQSWLADIYHSLLGLKAAISAALPHSWKWAHSKPDNACS